MRVAVCSDGVFPEEIGGIQRHTRLLVETLAANYPELSITILHTHPDRRLFGAHSNVTEVAVAPRPGRRNYLRECFDLSARFAAALRDLPNAVVYSQGLCVWSGVREFSSRLIVNPHGLEPYQGITVRQRLIGAPYRFIFGHIFKHSARVVSLGGRLTQILSRHVPGAAHRVVVLPNGVNVPEICQRGSATDAATCRLLFVGRFAPNKGIADLLQAMALLQRQKAAVGFELHLVGDGPLLDALRRDFAHPSIHFHGRAGDAQLEELYRACDVFVLPTLFEGMPTVVLEAMARSLPIIVTDVGATRELVDESNGFIVPKRDGRQLAETIATFAALPQAARQALGTRSREKLLQRFTWPKVAAAHYKVFRDIHQCFNHVKRT